MRKYYHFKYVGKYYHEFERKGRQKFKVSRGIDKQFGVDNGVCHLLEMILITRLMSFA